MLVGIIGSRTVSKDSYLHTLSLVRGLFKDLNKSEDIVISGGCHGSADQAARTLCGELKMQYVEAPALWFANGCNDKSAGLRRNTTIASMCDVLYAFWDGKSRGTADTMRKAKALGKTVHVIPI